MDIFQKCYDFLQRVDEVKSMNIYPYFLPIEENWGNTVQMEGRQIIMIGSNNYLGLSRDPRVREAAAKAIEKFGTSCSGSRFLNGTLQLHHELEEKLAEFTGKEAAITFSTGYQSNLGAISTLVGKGDYIITDKTNHASIFDGIFLSAGFNGGKIFVKRFKHNDMQDLERVLQSLKPEDPKLIVADGVFSMEGDIIKLPEVIRLAKQYKARVYIDEAHAIGVIGATGRGTGEHFDMAEDIDVLMCTFSKSFASLGGFIAGKKEVIDYIKHQARPLIFSASIPPANLATVLTTLEIIKKEPEHVQRLQMIGRKMKEEFDAMGFETGETETPIIPIVIGEDIKTFQFWRALYDAGIYANAVISPATPPGRALIRTSFMATHTDEELDYVLSVFKKLGKEFSII
ncbi:MAG: pyridoxal phosphate-dependent aminotransferase family protein [Calditrichia bacterium]